MDGWAAPEVVAAVEAHLVAALGPVSARASVSFLGVERIEVLRFGAPVSGLLRYVTVGMSRHPMADPTAVVVDATAPRAELVLAVTPGPGARVDRLDTVLRRLAVLAAAPAVEGVVVLPGATLDAGEPLWDGARFRAVLVGEPGDDLPPLLTAGRPRVDLLPLLPVTAEELAYKRVHGPAALRDLWSAAGTDLRDPLRGGVRLPPSRS